MTVDERPLARAAHWVHERFLMLLIGSYLLAAFAPSAGLWLRDVRLGVISLFGSTLHVGLSMAMLSCLLLNAGLGVNPGQAGAVARRPGLLAAGLAANLFIPILFILCVTRLMNGWHNADEVQTILVGLALVGSMPIAGSSTAWAQNAEGDLALSLGLVLGSTLLSPLTTPLALHAVGLMARGDYATILNGLAAGGTGLFLMVGVLAPSLAGMALRHGIGEARYVATRPGLKLVNSAILLTLNYANASVSLPKVVANPDWDFLAAIAAIVVALCSLAFVAGWGISQALGAGPSRRASLMFGLGMNNNGTGLVLASMALADHPRVMLPILAYNLVQHLVAGVVDRLSGPKTGRNSSGVRPGLAAETVHCTADGGDRGKGPRPAAVSFEGGAA